MEFPSHATSNECSKGICGNYQVNGEIVYVTEDSCLTLSRDIDEFNNQNQCEYNGGFWSNDDCITNWDWVAFDTKETCEASGGSWDNNLSSADILNEILDSPSIAYDVDVSFKVKNHHFQYGIKKVGSEFNSSGNPYIQKDIIEQYFSDKVRLLDNKMYLSFKMKKIKKWNIRW